MKIDYAFESISNKATDIFGKCPLCDAPESKIVWGWDGVYYDMLCPNDHTWSYTFPSNKAVKPTTKEPE